MLIVAFWSFLSMTGNCQYIHSRIELSAGYEKPVFHGENRVTDGDFSFPALFSNFTTAKAATVRILYNEPRLFSFGLMYCRTLASDWEYQEYADYSGSEVKIQTISPVVHLHSKYAGTGVLNRLQMSLELAPMFGQAELKLLNPLSTIQGYTEAVLPALNYSCRILGIRESVTLNWSFSRHFGVGIHYALQQFRIHTAFCLDSGIYTSQAGVSLLFKGFNDKRFYY